MKKHITIIAGHDNEEREEHTRTWLAQHGVAVEEWNGLQVLTLQAEQPTEGTYKGEWIVGFDQANGDQEESYLVINLEPDPYDTRIYVEFAGSYACQCRGKGCIECNEELARIERGEDPYAHHRQTFKVGEIIAIIRGEYKGQLGTIAGQEYEDPGNRERVCLVHLQGSAPLARRQDTGPATVVGIDEMESVKARS
jgi:hypothetical protein